MATDFSGHNDLDYVSCSSPIIFRAFIDNTPASNVCFEDNAIDLYANIYLLYSGNGNLTLDEAKSHFTAWALMKSPLFISTNVRVLSYYGLSIGLTSHTPAVCVELGSTRYPEERGAYCYQSRPSSRN